MKELIEDIAKNLVDLPEEVQVRELPGKQTTIFELKVAASDRAKIIGEQGKTEHAIRTILDAAGMKHDRRFELKILD
jgi:predicted RNA-binding protein YlqC (UPF0109 family)